VGDGQRRWGAAPAADSGLRRRAAARRGRERDPVARPASGNAAPSVVATDLLEDDDADIGDHFEEILKGLNCVICTCPSDPSR
jgi:hypothetical protein